MVVALFLAAAAPGTADTAPIQSNLKRVPESLADGDQRQQAAVRQHDQEQRHADGTAPRAVEIGVGAHGDDDRSNARARRRVGADEGRAKVDRVSVRVNARGGDDEVIKN